MGKGHRRCEVCGTNEGRHTGNKLFFSKFPLDPNRCREWLKAVGNEELVHLPIEKLHEQRNVCANHFEKKDFNKKGNRLKRHAMPSLNLMAVSLTDGQLAEFPQHMYRHSESKESNRKRKNIPETELDDLTECQDDELFKNSDYSQTFSYDESTQKETKFKESGTCTEAVEMKKDPVIPTVMDAHGCNYFGQLVSNELLRFDFDQRYVIMQKILEVLKNKGE